MVNCTDRELRRWRDLTMTRQDYAWLITRTAGFGLLIMALQTLPTLITTLPDIIHLTLIWKPMIAEAMTNNTLWTTLLGSSKVSHVAAVIVRFLAYLLAGLYLIGRGEFKKLGQP